MSTYAKYIDKYQKKQEDSKKIPADKETYISFLEIQLEKVSNALISSRSFDERLEEALNKISTYDERLNTMMKLIKLLQSFADTQELENAQVKERVTNSLGDFNKRLTNFQFECSKDELEAKVARLEKKLERTQQYFEENINKIDDQKNFKEYEKSFESLENKLNEKVSTLANCVENMKITNNSATNSINCETFVKEIDKKLEDHMFSLKELIEKEKYERCFAFEGFQKQNFQKEQIINNLTDELMTKIEDIEKNLEKNQENKPSNCYLKDLKALEEKTMRDINEIKTNLLNFNEKIEKNAKILMDKTFSFQDPGISRKDIEELERRISDKILVNFEKTYEVIEFLTKKSTELIKLQKFKRLQASFFKKTQGVSPNKENLSTIKSMNSNKKSMRGSLKEISPNKFMNSTDSELDNALFERSKRLVREGKKVLEPNIQQNLNKQTQKKGKSPSFNKSRSSSISKSRSPSIANSLNQSKSPSIHNNHNKNYNNNSKSPLKSSKESSFVRSRSVSQNSDNNNKKTSAKKYKKDVGNIHKNKNSSGKNKEKLKEKPENYQNEEMQSSTGSSFFTKSLKYDYNFSNTANKKRSLLSDKYKKLEKIYESLSKE